MKAFQINENFSVIIPDGWIVQEGESISIYEPDNGCGALQFSFYEIDKSTTVDVIELLREFLEDKYENANIIINRNCAYFEVTDKKDIYWRYWAFKKDNDIVLATYNCCQGDRNKEFKIVDSIIDSLF